MDIQYRKAFTNLPRCVGGIDYWHTTVYDLVSQVEHEVSLHDEGEENDIHTSAQLRQCHKYIARWTPLC